MWGIKYHHVILSSYLEEFAPGKLDEGGVDELDGGRGWLGRISDLSDKPLRGNVVAAPVGPVRQHTAPRHIHLVPKKNNNYQ